MRSYVISSQNNYGKFVVKICLFFLLVLIISMGLTGKVKAETVPGGCNAGDIVTVTHGRSNGEEAGTFQVKVGMGAVEGANFLVTIDCDEEGRYVWRTTRAWREGEDKSKSDSGVSGVPFGNAFVTYENVGKTDNDGALYGSIQFEIGGGDSYIMWMSSVEDGEDTANPDTGKADNAFDPTISFDDNREQGNTEENDTKIDLSSGVCYDNAGNLGWILCPIISGISGVGEWMWGEIETNFLQIRVGEFFKPENGVESAWKVFRDIANIVFIILFMFVIFSQLTGVGIDNYGIKKIMPKLIVVAILINLSYVICILAVDLSNILGVGLNGLFTELAKNVGTSAQVAVSSYTPGQSLAIAGIGAGVGGGIALFAILNPAIFVAAAGSMALAVFGIVITIVISILFLFLILMIRSAGIVILIAIAPVAIVCYMLPNTEKLFKRWVDLLKALLLVYPICGALVGAGKLAGIILASTNTEAMAVAGMIVEVLPFFLIPMLLKRSLSLAGNIGAKLSGVGKTAGRGLSSKAQGAIRGTQKFKDWSKYNQDKALATRSGRIQRRLQRVKDRGGTLSDRNKERLLQATEAMDAYERRRILADEGKTPLDGETLRQNIRAEKSNTLEKMYSDNYMRMTDRGQVDSAFQAALAGDSGENAAAAMNALIQKGGTTEVLNALKGADWSKMNAGVKSYLMQTMAASNVDALKAFSKYSQSGGQASFSDWSTGTGATIAAEASNSNIKAKSYAQHLMENGPEAMNGYSKDEMQFVQSNAADLRSELGNEMYGRMLGNAMVNNNDAKAKTIAEQIVKSELANTDVGDPSTGKQGRMDIKDLSLTSDMLGNMRKEAGEAILAGETLRAGGDANVAAQNVRNAFATQAGEISSNNRIHDRMDARVGEIIGVGKDSTGSGGGGTPKGGPIPDGYRDTGSGFIVPR